MLMNISFKKRTFLILSAVLAATTFTLAQQQPLPEWQSQYAVGLNKLAPHTYVWPYANASDIEKPGGYEQSPFYMSLNGKWKFHWVKNPDKRPRDFYQPSYYTGGWADINVPGNWERQGYGTAIYVNETYEFDDKMFNFKKNPPLVPHAENEVGSYRRTFKVPADWKGRRVVLCCEGVISFYYVWVNGKLLGYNQGSKTAAEWDITDVLNEGENVVALEVYRWSAGAYLECQDMWRLSGIERDVYLYSTPKQYIADYKLNASLDKEKYKDGIFGLEVTIIVFAADNGLCVGEHGLLGKQNLYEAAVRVPLVICGPNIPQNVMSDAYCYLYDLYPTLCDLSNIKAPATVKGISLAQTIQNPKVKKRKDILLTYINLQRAIKKDGFKLILYNVDGQRHPQLFDLKADPMEMNNLYDNPKYSKKREELTKLLYARMASVGDFCDPTKPDWGYPTKLKWEQVVKVNP